MSKIAPEKPEKKKRTYTKKKKAETKEVVKIDNNQITTRKVKEYLSAFGLAKSLSENEAKQFIEIAIAFQLNPFKREIYCVPYGSGEYRQLSIITGYQVYLKRAERTGLLNGWKVWIEGEGTETKAVIEINRKDWTNPLRHEAYFVENAKYKKSGELTKFWKTMPRFQLKKVAISQGFRLAFPDEIGGMPYTSDELPEEMTSVKNGTKETNEAENECKTEYKKIMAYLHNTNAMTKDQKIECRNKADENIDNLVKLKTIYTKLVLIKPAEKKPEIKLSNDQILTMAKNVLKTIDKNGIRVFGRDESISGLRAVETFLNEGSKADAMEYINGILKPKTTGGK